MRKVGEEKSKEGNYKKGYTKFILIQLRNS